MTKDRVQNLPNLVESARSGDRVCLEELVGLFHKEIFRMVYFRTDSQMDAEDLTQEIFIKMTKGLGQLQDPAHFKAWLYRIAINRVRDFHRKKRLFSFFSASTMIEDTKSPGTGPDPLRQVMEKEFWHQFHGLTRKMSRLEREVFILRYMDELGIREIADTLKRKESTVKTHLYRALRKFKEAHGFRALLEGNEL